MVGSCDVKFPIRLEGLAWSHGHFAQYEPELFPGLIYRMQLPKIVLLIFVSGKIVLTGGKNREDIYKAFENIYPVLTEFRKLPNPGEEDAPALRVPRRFRHPESRRENDRASRSTNESGCPRGGGTGWRESAKRRTAARAREKT
jgi:hypothetical protein